MKSQPMTAGMVRRMGATLAALFCLGLSALAVAQGNVVPPNGTLSADVIDLSVQTSAGAVEWKRTFNGTGWRFNRHWDGISASYKPVMTQNTGGGAPGMSYGSQGGAPATCWIWVDEDWQPGDGVTLPISGGSGGTPAPAVLPETYLPPNRSYNQTAAPLDTVITTGFASGCASIGGNLVGNSSEVLEGYRRQSTLYVGAGGTYIFKNRFTLQKQPIQKLAPITLPIGGSVSFVGLTSIASGWRWSDRAGDWAEYDDDGRISRYGDKNNNTVWLQRNAAGQIVRIIDGGTAAVSGNVIITLHYDAKGYLVQAKDWPQAGNSLDLPQRTVTYIYDTQGRMTGVTDVRGNTTAYEYDSKQRLTKTTDPRGGETKLTYDAEGTSVKSMTAADGGVTEYGSSWDSTKKLFYSKVTGPATADGRRVDDYSHDRAGDLVKYEVNGRTEIEIKRDPMARTETRTNVRGFATIYTRDEYEQVTQITYPDGAKTSTVYDVRLLNPVEETDELGIRTKYEYDVKGNLTKKTEALGLPEQRITEYQVDASGRPTHITRKGRTEIDGTVTQDATWQFLYDAAGQISQTIDPEGGRRTFFYNRIGQLAKYIDARSNATSYETDSNGNLVKVTDAFGQFRNLTYDKNNNLASSTDARGKAIQMAYDGMNRRLQTTNKIGGQYKLVYDARGLLIEQVDEDGRARKTTYDAFYRITSETDALVNATSYGYQITDGSAGGSAGSLGSPTEVQYPTFKKQFKYDSRERVASAALINSGAVKTQTSIDQKSYDARGQLVVETNANGKSRSYKYDVLGQLIESVDASGARSQGVYDARGNVIQIIDSKGNVTGLSFDRNDRLVKETLPSGKNIVYRYDVSGNLSERIDSNGIKKEYTYDLINRATEIRQIKSGNTVRTTNLTWDAENHLTAWSDTDKTRPIGQQTTTATLVYDDAGRKTAETVRYPTPGGEPFALGYGYQYSLAGYKTNLTWPNGEAIGYSWSKHGELEMVTIPGEGSISISQFKWIAPEKIVLPGGGVQEKTWDGLLNLESLKNRTPNQLTTLNLSNNYGTLQEIKGSARADSAGALSKVENTAYGYDDEQRLTQVKTDGGGLIAYTETFLLDSLGNRTQQTKTGPGSWVYDSDNRLVSRPGVDGFGIVNYDYDSVGNQIKKTEGSRITVYVYDGDNRLTEVRDGSENLIARYGYDPTNRRIWKEQFRDKQGQQLEQAQRIYFLYSDEGLVAEAKQLIILNADGTTNATTAPTVETQYGPRPNSQFNTGTLFIKTRNSNGVQATGYYLHDQLGTPIQAVDRNGNVVWAASYEAFGKATVITPGSTRDRPTIVSNLRLPGQYEDQETGLSYNWNRYLDVESGRFISPDPIGLGGGINRYAYVNHDPSNKIDPEGLKWNPFDELGRRVKEALGLECEIPGIPRSFGSPYIKSQVFRDDGWDTRKGKGPNDRGTDAVTLVRADMEARGYKFVGEQVVWNYQGYSRTYDLLMQAPDGRYVAVEVKSTITGIFLDNPRQNAADVALLRNGATIIDGTGVSRTVRLLSYQGVDFSSNISAGFSDWRAGRVIKQNGGDVMLHPIGPKQ